MATDVSVKGARLGGIVLAILVAAASAGCEQVQARRHIQEGNKLYYAGEYEKAVAEYDQALATRPDLTIGWYNKGLTHLAMFAPGAKTPENEAHAQGAIKAFNEYLKAQPKDDKARDYLLSTYIDSGHYEGALAYFEEKLKENPNDVLAIAQLAQINAGAGKFEDANKWHHKRAEIETSTDGKADALYSIGVLSWRRLNNKFDVNGVERAKIADEGIGALEEALAIRKDHQAQLTYHNLLYRERALAHEASWARATDIATAQVSFKKAMDIAKAQAAPSKPATPAPPGGKPAPNKDGK